MVKRERKNSKGWLVLLGLCISGSVFARDTRAPYVGIVSGVAQTTSELGPYVYGFAFLRGQEHRETHLIGGLLAGYERACTPWVWGLEGEIAHQWRATKQPFVLNGDNHASLTLEWERQNILSVSWRVGYEVAPYILPYARVGIAVGRDRIALTARTSSLGQREENGELWNGRLFTGLGLEVPLPLCGDGRFRVEYDYYFKNRPRGLSADAWEMRIQPIVRALKVALVWYFP